MRKTICLSKGVCPAGFLSFWYIIPSVQMRQTMIDKLILRFPELNYILTWNDKNGYGLQVSYCDWATKEYPGRRIYQ